MSAAGSIAVRLAPRPDDFRTTYDVAGCWLSSDTALPWMEPWAVDVEVAARARPCALPPSLATVHSGRGWIGGRWRTVACHADRDTTLLRIEGIDDLLVDRRRGTINRLGARPAADLALLGEAVLGPALLLALAARGVLSLHASATLSPYGVIAFVGDSGAGKSTLARLEAPGWRRVADDILPLAPGLGGPRVLPRFPQLKVPSAAQPGASLPPSLPLVGIYRLAPPGRARPAAVALEPLGPTHAMLALIRHTVPATLFDSEAMRWHLGVCASVARDVPIASLTYPWRAEALPAVRAAVLADLAVRHSQSCIMASRSTRK